MDPIGYLISEFKTNQFLSGGLVLTFLGGAFVYLRAPLINALNAITRIVRYSIYFDETELFFRNFNKWLNASRFNKKIRDVELTTSVVNKERVIMLNQREDHFLIWYKHRIVYIKKNQEKLEQARDFGKYLYNSYTISGLFAKKQIVSLCEEVLAFGKEDRPKNGFELYLSSDNEWSYGGEVIGRSYSSVIIDNTIKNSFLKDINEFLDSKEWYYSKGVPYRFGAMFEGPPGTGKTSFAKAIASETGMKLHYLTLSSEKMNDNSLMSMFFTLNGKSMVLVEDIDCLFEGRKSLTKNGVTFSGFLNAIDGVASREGVVVIFTTNKVSVLDPALMRNGRIDRIVRFDYPTAAVINEYFKMFFDKELGITQVRNQVSMAKIQDICVTNRRDFMKAGREINKVLNVGMALPTATVRHFPKPEKRDSDERKPEEGANESVAPKAVGV